MADLGIGADGLNEIREACADPDCVVIGVIPVRGLLAALDAAEARAVQAEQERDEAQRDLVECRNRDHGGIEPTAERIAQAHSMLPIKWLQNAHGSGHHPVYRQSADEACFICAIWNRAEAAEGRATKATNALSHLAEVAEQYFDTERGDLDGAVDLARAVLADLAAEEKK